MTAWKSIETGSIGEHTHETIVNTPPLEFLTTPVAALMAMLLAGPVWAQVNTVGLTGGNVVVREELGCLTAGINLTSTASIPAGTQVRYHVSTESGYDHFRNHGVAVWLGDGTTVDDIPSSVITANTAAAGTSVLLPGLCVADDRIDPRPDGNRDGSTSSLITIRLMSVAGFRIDRNRDSVQAFVRGDDRCTSPNGNGLNGGVVYKFRNGNFNDSCVCTTLAAVMAAYGESATYLKSSSKWRDDSTDYCADSPYQGLSRIDCTGDPLCTD